MAQPPQAPQAPQQQEEGAREQYCDKATQTEPPADAPALVEGDDACLTCTEHMPVGEDLVSQVLAARSRLQSVEATLRCELQKRLRDLPPITRILLARYGLGNNCDDEDSAQPRSEPPLPMHAAPKRVRGH